MHAHTHSTHTYTHACTHTHTHTHTHTLIHELIKSGDTVKQVNKSYRMRVTTLEEEARTLRQQLRQAQHRVVNEKEGKDDRGSHTSQQLDAQRQKLLLTEAKLKQLQQQQRDMQRLLRMRGKSEQRVVMLEGETERLRNQREQLN